MSRPPGYGRRALIIVAAAAALILLASFWAPSPQWDDYGQAYSLCVLLVLAIVIPGLAASRQRLSTTALQLGVWIGIMVALVAGYGYRFEPAVLRHRVVTELLASRAAPAGADTVSFRRTADGHFWIDAEVDDLPLHFLVDAGASGVVLTRADTERLGYRTGALSFDEVFGTANGRTRGGPIDLDRIRIGPIVLDDVPAWINEGELGKSLPGMRLLQRLSSVEMRNDQLSLRR